MRSIKLYLIFFCILSITELIAQDELAVQGRDYEFFTQTDEVGTGYKVISYYLKSISENKVLFYNFRITEGVKNLDVIKALPRDILILDPNRTSKFCTLKITNDTPQISWVARLLFPSVGFNKFPENGKQYVFFWESIQENGRTIYSYYIKNICDRRMKFYEFSLGTATGVNIVKDLPAIPVYLWPDYSVNVAKFSVLLQSDAPELTWQTIFTYFQPTGDDFCNELIKIFEASGEGDFGSVRGSDLGNAESGCNVKIPGINQARILQSDGKWFFNGQVGGSGLKKEIDIQFKDYFERIDLCIPDIIPIEVLKNKGSKNKIAFFTGFVDDKKYSGSLEVKGSESQPNDYTLLLTIFGAE